MALSGPPSPAAGIMDMNAMMQRTQEMQKFRPTMPKDRWWCHILELLYTGLEEAELTDTLVSTKVISEDMGKKAKEKGLRWLCKNAECDYLREQLQRRWIWLGPRVRPLMEKRRSVDKKEHVIEIASGYGMDVRPMACRCKWLRFHPTDDWDGAQGVGVAVGVGAGRGRSDWESGVLLLLSSSPSGWERSTEAPLSSLRSGERGAWKCTLLGAALPAECRCSALLCS